MAKKFENTKTQIFATVIDVENQTFNSVDYISNEYTRSEKKAEEIIREALDIEFDALVKITKLEQISDKPKIYNLLKALHDNQAFYNEDDARREFGENLICKTMTVYDYIGDIFYYDEEYKPSARVIFVTDYPFKYNKGNIRDLLKREFEETYPDCAIVTFGKVKREELEVCVYLNAETSANYEVK